MKYNLEAMSQQKHNTLLTFGGAYSNHIYATAAAGKRLGIRTIGIIRGELHDKLIPLYNSQATAACNSSM